MSGATAFVGRSWGAWKHSVAGIALSSVLGCGVAAAIVFTGHPAEAESSYESAYGFDRTWNAALRMVRVDMGCKILEKDDQTGYMMFEYHAIDEGKKVSSGSMEFIRPRAGDVDGAVRIILQLPQMPRYHEQVMLDTLARKMRTEYGDPPAPKPKPPPPAPAPSAPVGAHDGGVAPDADE